MSVNSKQVQVFSVVLDPASVGAATAAEQQFSCPGVRMGDAVLITTPAFGPPAGLAVGGARVIANDTIVINFVNPTAAPINANSDAWIVAVLRP